MLASPLRAFEPPTLRAYSISIPKPIELRPMQELLRVINGPFQFNPHAHMALTTIHLHEFLTPLTHTEFFKTVSIIPHLILLHAEPANGVFPELDILDPVYSPDLAPPSIPQRGGHRISLENLKHLVIAGKPSFCSAFLNQCKILNDCCLEVNCKDCAAGLASDPLDDILPQLRDRIQATMAMRHVFDEDDGVTGTEQRLEISRGEISILDDTRHAPSVQCNCNTRTKLTVGNPHGIDHEYFLSPILRVFGAPARPCIITLQTQDAVREGQQWKDLLAWLAGFDDCLNGVKFVDNHAFQYFAPLFTAVSSNNEAICGRLVELHFEKADFGVGTPNQAALLALLDFREGNEGHIDRLLFDECRGVHAEDFPIELEILIDGEYPPLDEAGVDDEDDMACEDDECDGNESDATIRNAKERFDDEGDSMDCGS